jgi:integrase
MTMAVARDAPLPEKGDYILRDTANRSLGLGLRIYASGSKTWICQKKVGKRTVRTVLGQFPGTTHEQAIRDAKPVIAEFNAGLDPNAEKRKRRTVAETEAKTRQLTIRVAYENYANARKDESSKRSIADRERAGNLLEHGPLWTKPLAEVTGGDVAKEYKRLMGIGKKGANGGATQAGATMRWLRAAIKHAITTDELVMTDPFAKFNELQPGWAKVNKRTRIVGATEGQLAAWWAAVESLRQKTDGRAKDAVAIADYLELSILFGGRSIELLSLRWPQVDLHERTVVFIDTKPGRDHTIPFATYAGDILKRRHLECQAAEVASEFVFPGSRSRRDGSRTHLQSPKKTLAVVAKLAGVPFSPHDLRRTFATLLEEIESVSTLTVERALNHAPTTTAGKHYVHQRLMRLRRLYQTLEDSILEEAGVNAAKHVDVPEVSASPTRVRKDGDQFIASMDTPDGPLEAVGATAKEARQLLQSMF